MPLIYQKWITRADLQANPQILYIFGDNMERWGMGGQAKEMRGEPNAKGIPTKWKPTSHEDAFFKDSDWPQIKDSLVLEYQIVENYLRTGFIVVWPLDGIGTGLSQLPQRAPKIWKIFEDTRLMLSGI